MINYIECWNYVDDFNEGLVADECEVMSDFNMLDPYIYETYTCFEIIKVTAIDYDNECRPYYIIDNSKRQ